MYRSIDTNLAPPPPKKYSWGGGGVEFFVHVLSLHLPYVASTWCIAVPRSEVVLFNIPNLPILESTLKSTITTSNTRMGALYE